MNNIYTLRVAEAGDVVSLTKLYNSTVSCGIAEEVAVTKELADNTSVTLLVLKDNEIVGAVNATYITRENTTNQLESLYYKEKDITFISSVVHGNVFVSINKIGIEKEHRQQGLAQELVRKVLECFGVSEYVTLIWLNKDVVVDKIKSKTENYLLIEKYWEEDEYPCPYCKGYCQCDALLIHIL